MIEASVDPDPVEKDTDESEEITNVMEFLIPHGTLPENYSKFGMFMNRKVLEGWLG